MKTKQNLIPICRLCAAMLPAVMAGLAAHAATINWTNTTGGNWSAASNWNPNQVPTNADVVFITTPGTYTVTLDVTTDYRNFYPTVTLGAGGGAAGVQTFAMTNVAFSFTNLLVNKGGVFKANGASVGDGAILGALGQTMIVDGGVLTSAGSSFENTLILTNGAVANATNTAFAGVTVVQNGCVLNVGGGNASWNGYTFLGPVTIANGGLCNANAVGFAKNNGGGLGSPYPSLTVAQGGTLNMAGNIATIYAIGITNAGTINITNAFIVMYLGGGKVLNQPGGVINIRGTGGVTGGDAFVNQGVVNETAGTGGTISVSAFDNTQGTITNLSGTLSLGTYGTELSGIYSAAAGAIILFEGDNVTPGTPFVLNGNGQFQFTGVLYLPTNVIPNLTPVGGYLELGPGFQGGAITNLALNGIILWDNTLPVTGMLAATNSDLYGNFTVASGGVLIATNSYLNGAVTVAGGGRFTAMSCSANAVTVSSGGVLNAIGGSFGATTVANNGAANLSGPLHLDGALTNSGMVNISNAAIVVYSGINNQVGGLMNIAGSGSTIIYSSGLEYFINRGTLLQNSSSSTNTINILGFDTSQGTVTNLAGILVLGTFRTNLAGTFSTATGATIQFGGGTAAIPLTPGTPLVLAGGGQFQFTSGYLTLPTNIIPGLWLQGGMLELGAAFQGGAITNLMLDGISLTNRLSIPLPITGQLIVFNSSGYVYPPGSFTYFLVGVYANLMVTGSGTLVLSNAAMYGAVTVANGGVVNALTHEQSSFGRPGSLTVQAGGVVNLAPSCSIYVTCPMTNAGTIYLTNFDSLGFNNDGSGTYLGGLINQTTGLIQVSSTTNASFNPGIGGSGGGYEYLINQGRIVMNNPSSACNLTFARITNSGAITALSGAINTFSFVTQPGGSLNVGLNNATNYGSFRIRSGSYVPDLASNIILAGAFNATLNNGYVPANGTTFSVFSVSSPETYSGNFSSLGLPSGVSWQSTYGATNLNLVAGTAKPQFGTLNLSGTNLIFSGTGGSPGSNYMVLTSTNVALPFTNWLALTTNTFDGSGQFHYTNPVSPAKPLQFFIFKSP